MPMHRPNKLANSSKIYRKASEVNKRPQQTPRKPLTRQMNLLIRQSKTRLKLMKA